jgi:hypothetical protein
MKVLLLVDWVILLLSILPFANTKIRDKSTTSPSFGVQLSLHTKHSKRELSSE